MSLKLRAWQQEALENYHHCLAQGARTLLWEATPGSGKTTVALQVCHHQLFELHRQRVIIIVPTTHLKVQWTQAAARVGIHLDSRFSNQQDWAADYHGVTLTYQQIANRPKFFRRLSRGAMVVLDEVHHAADGLMWGDSLREAFEEAGFILSLSGTAFRSDNFTIPFVPYVEEESMPDYVYPYGRAIEDSVCRSVAFFTYGGEVAWAENGEIVESRFSDELYGGMASRRLRAALDPKSGWMKTVLADAHQMLQETRLDHPDAGGLLVAASQEHARQLARLLTQITGTKPVIVLSDDNAASRKIKRFAAGTDEWIVACNMVSEGVDIPRLRVGVYATTVTTKMYFRQFLGRIVRVTDQPEGVQVAYCYLPADIRLRLLAEQIEKVQRHILSTPAEKSEEAQEIERDPKAEPPEWQPLHALNSGVEAVIVNGRQLSLWDDPGLRAHPAHVKKVVQQQVAERMIPLTKSETKTAIGQKIKQMVARYHRQSGQSYQDIYAYLNRAQNVRTQTECTEDQLRNRVDLLHRLLMKS